jgi:CheY-like chemotaxis protein
LTHIACKVTNLSTYGDDEASSSYNNLRQENYQTDHIRNLLLSEQFILQQQQQQQQQKNQAAISKIKEQEEKRLPIPKLIMMIDDNPDITITFKKALEVQNYKSGSKFFFKVHTYNDTTLALAEFKPNFYDLALIDINMPKMDGFEFSKQILQLDLNIRICYITAGEINLEALREHHPTLSIGCFIKKPVEIEYLVKRIKAELE